VPAQSGNSVSLDDFTAHQSDWCREFFLQYAYFTQEAVQKGLLVHCKVIRELLLSDLRRIVNNFALFLIIKIDV